MAGAAGALPAAGRRHPRRPSIRGLLVLVAAAAAIPPIGAQEVSSASLAKELLSLMTSRTLEAFAAEDPADTGHFVAVRAYPGVQLLVVDAKSSSTDYVKWQIEHRAYAAAYDGLDASAVPASKIFVQDMGCDGLRDDNGGVDVMYEHVTDRTLFDGRGKASGLSKTQYASKRQAAEERYRAMLTLLVTGLKAHPATPGRY
jgi:hypothetical protein